MPDTQIVPFAFEGVKVRTVLLDYEPRFVVADVAGALGLANPSRVAASLDEDDLRSTEVTDTLGRTQLAYITNEAGVYQTVFQSRKPEAVAFKRWVTREVIPSIRKHGTFTTTAAVREIPQDFATALREFAREIEAHEATQAALAAATPRAEAWDAIASAEGDYSVGDAAKILARRDIVTGPTRLFEQLHTLGWTFRGEGGKWRAYQGRVDRGYLAERPQFHYHPRTKELVTDPPQLRVTIKGLERLRQALGATALKAVTR